MTEVEGDMMGEQGRGRNQRGFKAGFINRQREVGKKEFGWRDEVEVGRK